MFSGNDMKDGIEQKCFKIPFDALVNVMFCNVTLTIEIETNQKNSNFDFKSKFAISSGITYFVGCAKIVIARAL